jgi:hypothetical protein
LQLERVPFCHILGTIQWCLGGETQTGGAAAGADELMAIVIPMNARCKHSAHPVWMQLCTAAMISQHCAHHIDRRWTVCPASVLSLVPHALTT